MQLFDQLRAEPGTAVLLLCRAVHTLQATCIFWSFMSSLFLVCRAVQPRHDGSHGLVAELLTAAGVTCGNPYECT